MRHNLFAASQLFDRIHFLRGGSMNFNRPKVRACVWMWARVGACVCVCVCVGVGVPHDREVSLRLTLLTLEWPEVTQNTKFRPLCHQQFISRETHFVRWYFTNGRVTIWPFYVLATLVSRISRGRSLFIHSLLWGWFDALSNCFVAEISFWNIFWSTKIRTRGVWVRSSVLSVP